MNYATTSSSPQMAYIPQGATNTVGGTPLNWNFILNSMVAQNLGQGIAHGLPNSQQNAVKDFNRQQFSPLNYLPYTPNNSLQDQYGMKRGGTVRKMAYGGNPYEDNPDETSAMDFRKWIMDEQGESLPQDTADAPELQAQDTSDLDAQDFAQFMQMFAQSQQQGDMRKGGKVKYDTGGMTGDPTAPTVTPTDPRYNLADIVNFSVANGQNPLRNPQSRTLANSTDFAGKDMLSYIQIFNSNPAMQGLSAQQRLAKFYDTPTNNPQVQGMKDQLKALGQGPSTLYRDTPDDRTRQFDSAVKFEQGGPVTDGELYEILGDDVDDDKMEYLKAGGWIQKATASIKRRGTKGVCTGSNFGGPSCRPGTRRYNLAKVFKAMAKHRKKHEQGGPIEFSEGGEYDLQPEHVIGLIGQGYDFDL